jgi:hypothetical protein
MIDVDQGSLVVHGFQHWHGRGVSNRSYRSGGRPMSDVSDAEARGLAAGLILAGLLLLIFSVGVSVGRGMGKVQSEVVEKEGGR